MKLLFSADWHIKLGAKNIPVDWATNRFRTLFAEMYRVEQLCDIHIIGGDIFDKLPNMAELELYFEFVGGVTKPTIIYPGNHEALKKDTSFLTNLKLVTSRVNPLVSVVDEPYSELLGGVIDIIPYGYVKTFRPEDFSGTILCTHVRGEIPPHVKPEVDLAKFDRWQVVLAGDLHSYENSQRNILYPGSPLTTSFHRSPTKSGVILLDVETLTHEWLELKTPQLIRKTVQVGEAVLPTDYDLTIYEVEGSLDELSELADDPLVEKRVSKKTTDVSLMLSADMTLVDEVTEYLRYILEVSEETVGDAIKVLKDNERHITEI
jgi:DNA repair exonuclease SbcCD nuclease subunit